MYKIHPFRILTCIFGQCFRPRENIFLVLTSKPENNIHPSQLHNNRKCAKLTKLDPVNKVSTPFSYAEFVTLTRFVGSVDTSCWRTIPLVINFGFLSAPALTLKRTKYLPNESNCFNRIFLTLLEDCVFDPHVSSRFENKDILLLMISGTDR